MIHPDTYISNTPKGLGLFTRRRFQKGEILWIIDDVDVKLSLSLYNALDHQQQNKINIYCYLDYQNRVIIPWDEGKYVNHSCSPNSTGLLEYDNISVALRDIDADEEIVEDYSSYFGHFETFTCRCGSANCRQLIDQHTGYRPELRLVLSEVAPLLLSLPQPLLDVASAENKELVERLHYLGKPNGVNVAGKVKL